MGQVRSALRAYALLEEDPAAVVANLDRFVASLGEDPIVTLAFVAWHPRSGTARVVLAGHPAPAVRAADGTVSALDADPGLPLGALPAAGVGYVAAVHHLPPGATLVLFSDGLVESRQRSVGAGLEQLAAVLALAPPDVSAACDLLVSELTAGQNLDDVALLAVRAPAGRPERSWVWRAVPPEAGKVPVLRAGVRNTLWAWHAPVDVDVVELLVTELAANAVRHARAAYDLELRWDGHTLVGVLVDAGSRPRGPVDLPAAGVPDRFAESGRGLLLVATLASAWGTTSTPAGGTSTWFRLDADHAGAGA